MFALYGIWEALVWCEILLQGARWICCLIRKHAFLDFEILCREKGIQIVNKTVVDGEHKEHWTIRLWPSMLGEIAVYHIKRK